MSLGHRCGRGAPIAQGQACRSLNAQRVLGLRGDLWIEVNASCCTRLLRLQQNRELMQDANSANWLFGRWRYRLDKGQ
jgi:hypothetical protein